MLFNAMKRVAIVALAGAMLLRAPFSRAEVPDLPVADQFRPLPGGAIELRGVLGKRLDLCIANRLILQDTEKILDLYRTREKDVNGYHGEFFGKWASAAAWALRYQPNGPLREKLACAVADLIPTASAAGYLSTYKTDAEFRVWDVWNQKYNLLGLVANYDLRQDRAALNAAALRACK